MAKNKSKIQKQPKANSKTNRTVWTITTIVVVAVFIIAIAYISLNKKDTSDYTAHGNENIVDSAKTEVLVFDWKGEIQKELKFKVWKQKTGYTENIYKGGPVKLKISSSNNIAYNLTSGENCLFSVDEFVLQTGLLKDDSIVIDNTTPGTSYPYNPNNLCINLENTGFIDWSNVNPATITVEIYELK
ncbi:hypothetical protein COV15_02505 [Candidatus Woesearchaeota archaeon CG10_big_fil_rev_8_21_14_0_10_34_12]|nr:MAG: hypothetical protein COV15_02505 [Candidatus Woesearchaeota archaeon CG10_big_fil_rev_8_21_14_0_10_34_12]